MGPSQIEVDSAQIVHTLFRKTQKRMSGNSVKRNNRMTLIVLKTKQANKNSLEKLE